MILFKLIYIIAILNFDICILLIDLLKIILTEHQDKIRQKHIEIYKRNM